MYAIQGTPGHAASSVFITAVYVYSAIRVASVIINFAAYIVLCYRLRDMGLSLFGSKDQPRHPVAALSSRMIYYPIVQVSES